MNGNTTKKAMEVLSETAKKSLETPGAGAQRLSALTDTIDWSRVEDFELDWKAVRVGDDEELVPVVNMTMKPF